MRRGLLVAGLLAAFAATAADDPEKKTLTYDVIGLEGKLLREVEPKPERLEIGDQAHSGDRLRTKSSSQADLEVVSHAALFRLGSGTRCTLAHDRPGLLLHVEKGHLRAIFGAFSGEDARLVTTPSAVLAVRGTQYGLQVEKDGDTRLVVFQGVVDVIDPTGVHPPVRVESGQQTRIKVDKPPKTPSEHRISPRDWDLGRGGSIPGAAGSGFNSGSQGGATGSPGPGSQGAGSGSKRRGG